MKKRNPLSGVIACAWLTAVLCTVLTERVWLTWVPVLTATVVLRRCHSALLR